MARQREVYVTRQMAHFLSHTQNATCVTPISPARSLHTDEDTMEESALAPHAPRRGAAERRTDRGMCAVETRAGQRCAGPGRRKTNATHAGRDEWQNVFDRSGDVHGRQTRTDVRMCMVVVGQVQSRADCCAHLGRFTRPIPSTITRPHRRRTVVVAVQTRDALNGHPDTVTPPARWRRTVLLTTPVPSCCSARQPTCVSSRRESRSRQ